MGTPLKGYGQGMRKDTLLGWAAWYSISDPEVEHPALKAKVEELGLDATTLPAPLRPGDSFKRACRYAKDDRIVLPGTDNYANVLIRSVKTTNEFVERHLVIETVDPEKGTLSFDTAAHLVLNKFEYRVQREVNGVTHSTAYFRKADANDAAELLDKAEIPFTVATSTEPRLDIDRTAWASQTQYRQVVEGAIAKFTDEYEHAQKFLDAQTLRMMIRKQLDEMRAFKIRKTGSVYFIPRSEEETAIALSDLLEWIGNDSGFHMIPLIDAAKQRELLQAAFEDEVHDQAHVMLNDLGEKLRAKEPITSSLWSDYQERKTKMLERAREYSDLVEQEFAKAGTELALLEDMMFEMLESGLIKASRS